MTNIDHQIILSDSVKTALKQLNGRGYDTVLFVKSITQLMGSLTDGDIRRSLLRATTSKLKLECLQPLSELSTTRKADHI